MSACHISPASELPTNSGGASSSNRVEPHFPIAQSGASRSASPESERIK